MENNSIRKFTCDDCLEVSEVDWSKVRPDLDDGTSNIEIHAKGNDYAYYGECMNCGNLVEIEPPAPELVVDNVDVDKDGMYIQLTDTVTNRSCWVEAWQDENGDWEYDFNQYIFHLDNDNDIVAKMFQEDLGNYAEEVFDCVMGAIDDYEDEYNKLQENKTIKTEDTTSSEFTLLIRPDELEYVNASALAFDSDTTIAIYKEENYELSLMVRGSVKIQNKENGDVYKNWQSFPDDLKELITSGEIEHGGETNKYIVDMNNWFEWFLDKDNDNVWYDVADIEGMLNKPTPEENETELEVIMKDLFDDIVGQLNEGKKVEAKFKDKVKAIKKSLKKNDKRLSDETAKKSAEKIAGSMVKKEESKTADMDTAEIVMELEGGELTIVDVEDWNAVKSVASDLQNSQGYYGRLLRDMLETEEEFGGVENLPFPITM